MYGTEQDTIDAIRDYLNGSADQETWDQLKTLAEAILQAYDSRNDPADDLL